jgi:hypothetical protein
MIKYIIILFSLLFIISCGRQKTTQVKDDYIPEQSEEELYNKLEDAFINNKFKEIGHLFIEWNRKIKPNTEEYILQNDTFKAIFNAFNSGFQPDTFKEFPYFYQYWRYKDAADCCIRYFVIPNAILFSIADENNFENIDYRKLQIDTLFNFRPHLDLEKQKILYLTPEYNNAINKFLKSKLNIRDCVNIDNDSIKKLWADKGKRYKVISQYIRIFATFGTTRDVETHPIIYRIIFNKALTKAKLGFRIGEEGGYILVVKKRKKWVFKEYKITWVE